MYLSWGKYLFDCLFIVLFLPILLLLLFCGVLVVIISSKGSIFFKQKRVGLHGNVFDIYKLRTMYTADNQEKKIIPLGNFLRATKIDELPQIWNILKGEMSLVGPRPEREELVQGLLLQNKNYANRHVVKPGITGWSQVNMPHATPKESFEKLVFDLEYVQKVSLLFDIQIMLKTITVLFPQK